MYIWEIGCLECPPFECICTIGELTGPKIPRSLKISGRFDRVAILNLETDFSCPLEVGKYRLLSTTIHVYRGLNVFCVCSLRKLKGIELIPDSNIHLSGAKDFRLIPAGFYNHTAFVIYSKVGNMPSLYQLSQLTLLKTCHSYVRIRALIRTGLMPHSFLKDFPSISIRSVGFHHEVLMGKRTIRFTTCHHAPYIKIYEDGKRDDIIF